MTTAEATWTAERITRLEATLALHTDDSVAQSLLQKLSDAQSLEEKQHLVTESMPELLRQGEFVRLWEGEEIEARLALRDLLLDYLHQEHVIQNVPTGEQSNPNEDAERARLSKLFGQGKRVSDLVIEGRG